MCHQRWKIFKAALRSQKTRSKFLCEPFRLPKTAANWEISKATVRRGIETFDGAASLLRTNNTSRALKSRKSTSSRIITSQRWGRKVLCQEKGNICAVFPLPSPSSASLSAMLSSTHTNKTAEESVFKWLYLKEAFDVESASLAPEEEETRSCASERYMAVNHHPLPSSTLYDWIWMLMHRCARSLTNFQYLSLHEKFTT